MAFAYPQDSEELKKERRSYQVLFYNLNADVWASNGYDKTDHGMDYGFEYIESGEYKGFRILSQIKSTENINMNDEFVRFDLSVKTASYAVAASQPFVLFVVVLKLNLTYYMRLQDYFINNEDSFIALQNNKRTIRIKIPVHQVVTRASSELERIAKCQYSFIEGAIVQTRCP